MILKVAWSLIIIVILEDISIQDDCTQSMKNRAAYEGDQNVIMTLIADSNNVKWSCIPTIGELGSYNISNYNGTRDPSLTGLFYPNQSGLVILNATTTEYGGPISTAGLYIAQCANSIYWTAAKLLVVRRAPECSCNASSPTNVTLSCTIFYADSAIHPIYANITWKIGDIIHTTDTPSRTRMDYKAVFESTSTITVDSYSLPATFTCTVTFNAPVDIEYALIAKNAPEFSVSCSVAAFRISMEPLFGPMAGGTKITIIGSATFEYLSKYAGSNITGVRYVYIGKDLSSTTVSLLTIGSATFEFVAVTPNTTEATIIGQPLPIIIEFSPTPFNMTFNTTFTYLPNPGITAIYPNIFIASGGTLLDVTGRSLSSVAKPIIQLTVVLTRAAENNSSSTTSATSTSRVCTVPIGNDTYMQCPMPPLSLPNDFLEILNSLYNTSTSRRRRSRKPVNQLIANSHSLHSRLKRDISINCVLSVYGPNGVDRADICLGIIFDGYKAYENINDLLQGTKFIFYSDPEINSSNEVIEFDPSEDELIYVKSIKRIYNHKYLRGFKRGLVYNASSNRGRYMLRGCFVRDYLVHIENQICINDNLTDNELSCRPPKEKPSSTGNDSLHCGQHLSITVTVGYKLYQYACLTYPDNSKTFALIVGLTVGLAGFALFITILIACIVRCRRKKTSQDTDTHQTSGGQEIINQHYNTDVEPESHQDYNNARIYTRQNTISLYKPNDEEYSTTIDEFDSNA